MRIALVLAVTLVSSAGAETLSGECEIRFVGTSTLHDFTGTVRCQPFTVDVVDVAGAGKTIPTVEIAVPVEEIDTKNGKRDKQMREMFQYDKFPHIRGALKDVDADNIRKEIAKGPGRTGSVEFTLRIRDIERAIRTVIRNFRETPERVTFDAEFPVSLKAFGLVPPTVFFGAVRVGDTVTVNAAFRLSRSGPK